MRRYGALAALLGLSAATGCASTWDTLSSRRFRDDPLGTVMDKSDPLTTLRTGGQSNADERARAIGKLAEPAASGQGPEVQDEVMQMLSTASNTDASPWVRVSAIETLGRFRDPRVPEVLRNAYLRATGPAAPEPAENPIQQAGVRPSLAKEPDRLPGLFGPQGYPPDQVANIRTCAVAALVKTNSPLAVEFLARVAAGGEFALMDDEAARGQVRASAVAGLGQMRQKEAAVALNKVLAAEQGKDVALASLAYTGLKSLTGKSLPQDPAQWDQVIQAGFEIAPEPSGVERAVQWVRE